MRLRPDVSALENLSMHPNERACRSCKRRGRSNWRETNPCWEKGRCRVCFSSFFGTRESPLKPKWHNRAGGSKTTRAMMLQAGQKERRNLPSMNTLAMAIVPMMTSTLTAWPPTAHERSHVEIPLDSSTVSPSHFNSKENPLLSMVKRCP